MIIPSVAREDLAALTDELISLVAQIPDEQLRRRAFATLVTLDRLHGRVIHAFDRTATMAALDWRLLTAFALALGSKGLFAPRIMEDHPRRRC
jgi:hypothetical protein